MSATWHAHFLCILSQLCCSIQFLMAFSPTLSKYIADPQLTVTGFDICVQGQALKQSTSRQPGCSVCRRHVGVSQLLLLPSFPCLGSQMACSRPKPEHCVWSCRSGSQGSSTNWRSELAEEYQCNPCPSGKARRDDGELKGCSVDVSTFSGYPGECMSWRGIGKQRRLHLGLCLHHHGIVSLLEEVTP